jgi:hypothetical protein
LRAIQNTLVGQLGAGFFVAFSPPMTRRRAATRIC